MASTVLSLHLFNNLYRRYEQMLIAIAFSFVRDYDTAKDVVNDSFLALWESRDRVEFTNIEAYLFRVVKNNCLRHRRDEQIGRSVYENILRKERGAMDYYTRTIECCDPNELFRSEILEICRAELEQMPELTRQIFKAHKIEGKSYREIAEHMNLNLKKVDKELQHAAVKLRHSLKDYLTILVLLMLRFV